MKFTGGVSNDPSCFLASVDFRRSLPGYAPKDANTTPEAIVLRPALRGGVSWSGEGFDPAPLTYIIFDP